MPAPRQFRAGNTHHQVEIRKQTVACAQDRSTKGVAACRAVTAFDPGKNPALHASARTLFELTKQPCVRAFRGYHVSGLGLKAVAARANLFHG